MYLIEIRHQETETGERAAYDSIYAERTIRMRDSFYLWFLEQLRPYGLGQLLDVSCGDGHFLQVARQAGYSVAGIDFSRAALRRGQAYGPGLRLALANAQQLPFPDHSFDVVTNIGSLEHYFDPAEGAREMARVLRPGGVALILLPNTFGLFGNLLHVLQHGEVFDDGQPLQRYGTRAAWSRLLAENGLLSQHVVGYDLEAPRTTADLRWLAGRPWKLARMLAGRLLPVNLANALVFICRPEAAGDPGLQNRLK